MPRRASGPKLWFDKERGTWTILDGRGRHRTGFTHDQAGDAEKALGKYIASKHTVKDSAAPFIADVLAAYSTEHLAHKVSGRHILYDIEKLAKWWGGKRVSDITAKTCRAYAGHRKAPSSTRRELAFLNAALVYWNKEHGPLTAMPAITLAAKPAPRSDWMTREEAAQFLRHARKIPHLARFFIIGWYTGSRRTVIMGLKWSMINLDTGIMLRKERGAVQTSKRAPPVRMGDRLMAHLRRWKRMDGKAEFVITYRGKRMLKPTDAWLRVRRKAGLPDHVIPHVLRHSRATTMMRAGVNPWTAANALGMSLEVLTKVYGHHHPDWQKDAADAR